MPKTLKAKVQLKVSQEMRNRRRRDQELLMYATASPVVVEGKGQFCVPCKGAKREEGKFIITS